MSKQTDSPAARIPRFPTGRLPRGLGAVLAGVGGPVGFIMILAAIQETSILLTIITILMVLFFLGSFVVGILAILAPMETVSITPQGVTVRLGALRLKHIDAGRLRSVVARTREVRLGMSDSQVMMLEIYFNGSRMPLWMEWTPAAEDAFRRELPQVNLLL